MWIFFLCIGLKPNIKKLKWWSVIPVQSGAVYLMLAINANTKVLVSLITNDNASWCSIRCVIRPLQLTAGSSQVHLCRILGRDASSATTFYKLNCGDCPVPDCLYWSALAANLCRHFFNRYHSHSLHLLEDRHIPSHPSNLSTYLQGRCRFDTAPSVYDWWSGSEESRGI